MSGDDIKGVVNSVYLDIRDKLQSYEVSQRRAFILLQPRIGFPKGKFVNGYVQFVNQRYCNFLDDKDGVIQIYFSEIGSTADIKDSRKTGYLGYGK